MYIAYVDDSGDEHTFALGVILVPADGRWLTVHDELVAFRSALSKRHGFRMARELKSSQVVTNSGPWRKLKISARTRHGIYAAALQQLAALHADVSVFGVVVPDRKDPALRGTAVEEAWLRVFERLERFCDKNSTTVVVMPDDGHPLTVRRLARRSRRMAYAGSAYGGSISVPFRTLIDDPAHRDSSDSYEIQFADLVAYAAFRRVFPTHTFPPNMWERLGSSLLAPVNAFERRRNPACDEPAALVVTPHRRLP